MKQLEIAFNTYSDIQSNENNNSFFHKDNLIVMVEGTGGEYLSDVAKNLTCLALSDSFFRHVSENHSPGKALLFALEQANAAIIKESNRRGNKMTVSVSVVYIHDNTMYFTHLGDSRVYFFYDEEIEQLTSDYSLVEEDFFTHKPFGDPRLPASGLGIQEKPDIQVKKYTLPRKGLIMMTAGGLTGNVSQRELLRLSPKNNKPERISDDLFNLVLKKGDRIKPDAAVGIIKFGGTPRKMRTIIFTCSVFFLTIMVLIGGYLITYEGDGEKPKNKAMVSQGGLGKDVANISDVTTPQIKIGQVQKAVNREPEKEITIMADDVDLFDRTSAFVGEWKKAWEMSAGTDGDMDGFLVYYSDRFKAGGFDKASWGRDKTQKNRRKKWIRIEISDIQISGPDDKGNIEVRFSQDYRSSNYASKGKKLIVLSKEIDGWKIIFERGS